MISSEAEPYFLNGNDALRNAPPLFLEEKEMQKLVKSHIFPFFAMLLTCAVLLSLFPHSAKASLFASEQGAYQMVSNQQYNSSRQQAFSSFTASALARQQGNIPEAISQLQQALSIDNSSFFLWTALADLYWEQGDVVLTEEILQKAMEQGERTYEMFLLKGFLLLSKGEKAQALEAFSEAGALNPEGVRAYEMLAVTQAAEGNYELAIAAVDKLLKLTPENLGARLLRARCFAIQKNLTAAVSDLETILANHPQASLYEELAHLFYLQENASQALAIYQEALALFPNDCRLRLLLAKHLLDNGSIEKAETVLWRQETATPWCAEQAPMLALLSIQTGNLLRALIVLDGIIGSGEVDARIYYLYGLAYEGLGEKTKALAAYANIEGTSSSIAEIARLREARILMLQGQTSTALAKLQSILPAPRLPEAHLFLADIYSKQDEWLLAEKTLRQALCFYENNVDILYSLGFLLDKRGKQEEALALMQRILVLQPQHIEALNFIGYDYAKRGVKLSQARELIARALAQDPDNGYLLDSMGWVLFQKKHYAEALSYLERAYRLLPEEEFVLEHLAQAYEKMGRYQEAQRLYERLGREGKHREEIDKINRKIKHPSLAPSFPKPNIPKLI